MPLFVGSEFTLPAQELNSLGMHNRAPLRSECSFCLYATEDAKQT